MGWFSDNKSYDQHLLAEIRGYRMAHCSARQCFDELRERYQAISDSRLWEHINYIYE